MNSPLRWKLVVGFLLVFVAGLVAGAFLDATRSRHHRLSYAHRGELAKKVRLRMQSRLDLTPQQVTKTAPILEATGRRLEEIRAETGRRVHETFAEADRQLAPELTAEQRTKLASLEAHHEALQAEREKQAEDQD